jgi:hypothetical protein
MVIRGIVFALLGALCTPQAAASAGEKVDLARWAAALPPHFAVHGVKTEPTYEEAIDISRDGDLVTVIGGAPGWAARATERLWVSSSGALLRLPCPGGADCAVVTPPSGFLATAALMSASARGELRGVAAAIPYGTRRVICLPAEMIGVAKPILDPCFDRENGAVLAQRHRLSGRFDGPSLEPSSIRID